MVLAETLIWGVSILSAFTSSDMLLKETETLPSAWYIENELAGNSVYPPRKLLEPQSQNCSPPLLHSRPLVKTKSAGIEDSSRQD